jgi:hypothetical protein
VLRAAFWLLSILLLWAALYTKATFEGPSTNAASVCLSPGAAIVYSVQVAALQKPDPKPLSWRVKALVTSETILGPAQAALLLLAIRRKFMR